MFSFINLNYFLDFFKQMIFIEFQKKKLRDFKVMIQGKLIIYC